MAVASKSAYLQLFDHESKDDTYSYLVTNSQAKVSFVDSKDDRSLEFKSQGGYQFVNADGATSFNLETRLSGMETDISTNASDPQPQTNADAIAAMDVAYKAKDAQIEAAASAEVTRASQAEAANTTAITAEETRALAAEAALAQDVVDEASARATALTAETARAQAAEQANAQAISQLLSNVSPELIDSISELLSHVNAADASLISTIATLQAEHDDLKARFDELVNE